MEIEIDFESCSFERNYLVEEISTARINIHLTLPVIVSVQSRRALLKGLRGFIQGELAKFEWIISGSVVVEFLWYLNAVERQETDKVGDMDNISKPIQDALVGPDGILIDDSQIGGLYTYWQTRNDEIAENKLHIQIDFNNDSTISKKNLYFIQYSKAICLPVNISEENRRLDLLGAVVVVHARRMYRRAAQDFRKVGGNIDRYFVCSEWDFHRTRLNYFPQGQILSISQLMALCREAGLRLADFRPFFQIKHKPSEDAE